ncbi:MAG: potassium-transporting ATPase subunit KdpA [Gemmataceae bacterium]
MARVSRGWAIRGASTTRTRTPSTPAPFSPHWDIACGLVMVLCRFIPIIAPIAFAASLARKKPTPFTSGTLRTDTTRLAACSWARSSWWQL